MFFPWFLWFVLRERAHGALVVGAGPRSQTRCAKSVAGAESLAVVEGLWHRLAERLWQEEGEQPGYYGDGSEDDGG